MPTDHPQVPVTETISVPEIHCAHCQSSIEGALSPLDGVGRAEVDVAARTVAVDYDPGVIDREVLIAAIEDEGYEVPR